MTKQFGHPAEMKIMSGWNCSSAGITCLLIAPWNNAASNPLGKPMLRVVSLDHDALPDKEQNLHRTAATMKCNGFATCATREELLAVAMDRTEEGIWIRSKNLLGSIA